MTIKQNDIQAQRALARRKGLIDANGKMTDKAWQQAMDAIKAYASKGEAK